MVVGKVVRLKEERQKKSGERTEEKMEKMKVRVYIRGEQKECSVEIQEGDDYEHLLENLGLNPVEVIVLQDGEPVPEDEIVRKENRIEIIRVVSGG